MTFFSTTTDSILAERNGQPCTIVGPLAESEYDRDILGPMFEIRFDDDEIINAFEDELHNA